MKLSNFQLPTPNSPKRVIALIDCNNFFVSCEKIFRPDLEGRPVVVLSSNDGCAVARSNEAKALGIPMGAPAFKFREIFEKHRVVKFSANFDLYGDVSERITRLLREVTPQIEVYSVDESFMDLAELNIKDLTEWGKNVRTRILKEIGVPVSIGIAQSKTLAKLAAARAKKAEELAGVLDLSNIDPKYLIQTPVEDIWGVGRRLGPRLRVEGVATAYDLARMRPQLARKMMGVHGEQMVAELNGVCCLPVRIRGKVRQSLMHGRLFGEDTKDPEVIRAAIATLTSRAASRLRKDGLLARKAGVRLATNRQRPGYLRHYAEVHFGTPTADTGLLSSQLTQTAHEIMRHGILYHRADIYLYDFVNKDTIQTDLLGYVDIPEDLRSQARLRAVDALNARYGKRAVHYAAEDLSGRWKPKHNMRSPRYTTHWGELPEATLR